MFFLVISLVSFTFVCTNPIEDGLIDTVTKICEQSTEKDCSFANTVRSVLNKVRRDIYGEDWCNYVKMNYKHILPFSLMKEAPKTCHWVDELTYVLEYIIYQRLLYSSSTSEFVKETIQ